MKAVDECRQKGQTPKTAPEEKEKKKLDWLCGRKNGFKTWWKHTSKVPTTKCDVSGGVSALLIVLGLVLFFGAVRCSDDGRVVLERLDIDSVRGKCISSGLSTLGFKLFLFSFSNDGRTARCESVLLLLKSMLEECLQGNQKRGFSNILCALTNKAEVRIDVEGPQSVLASTSNDQVHKQIRPGVRSHNNIP
jgi:hypothetical protein